MIIRLRMNLKKAKFELRMRKKMAFQYKYYILAVFFCVLAPPYVFQPMVLRQTMYYLIFQGLRQTFMP